MKVTFRNKSSEFRERVRHRLQVSINQVRLAVDWDWAVTNEHCREVFGAIVQDMTEEQLYRFLKDLFELHKFHQWRATHGQTPENLTQSNL